MNIAALFGTFDPFSAAVAIASCIGFTIIVINYTYRKPSKKDVFDFELAKIRLSNEKDFQTQNSKFVHEKEMANILSRKEVEFKRIESGLIDLKPTN